MKKIIAILTIMALLMSATSVFAASTATSEYNAQKSTATDQYFTTSGKIENGGSGFVTLLVTTDGSINVNNIMYIDQTVADSNGNFSFTDYIPKVNVPTGGKYVVKVGATSLPNAISGGYLEVPVTGHTVSGSVINFIGGVAGAALKIKKDGVVVASGEMSADGKFSIANVPNGEYYMVVTKKAHLPAVATVKVDNANVTVSEVKLLPGDCVTGDDEIGYQDLSTIIDIYGAKTGETGYKADYDIDDNGDIGYTELSAIIDNYGVKADPLAYDE